MTIADLGTALERAVLERVRAILSGERSGPPAVIGVRSGEVPIWRGPAEHVVEGRRVRVEACPSVLAVLDALARHAGSDTTLVILTDRPEVDLGDDVLARLHRGKLFDASRQTLLDDLLGARQLDPGIRRHGWLVDALAKARDRTLALLVVPDPPKPAPKPPPMPTTTSIRGRRDDVLARLRDALCADDRVEITYRLLGSADDDR